MQSLEWQSGRVSVWLLSSCMMEYENVGEEVRVTGVTLDQVDR